MKGRCHIVRYTDDFIIGFEAKSDAERVMEVLPKRLERFGLALNMNKTKLIPWGIINISVCEAITGCLKQRLTMRCGHGVFS